MAGKRVLVVDDDPDIRELLFSALEDEGFEVVPAANGAEALAVIRTFQPDVILAWHLPYPGSNQPWMIPIEHLVITSSVSIVAALVAFLVARAAIGSGQYRALLVAIGFACMAGIFAVHGLSTPNVLQRGDRAIAAALVIALSGELALAVAAVFFAIRYTPLATWLERRVRPRALVTGVVAGVVADAGGAPGWPAAPR